MSKKTYYELLQDPRWQKKRLEIFKASNFACSNCSETTKTLHAHHGAYLKGRAPWEYPDEMLHCLCEDCHELAEKIMQLFNRDIGSLSMVNLVFVGTIIDVIFNKDRSLKDPKDILLSIGTELKSGKWGPNRRLGKPNKAKKERAA